MVQHLSLSTSRTSSSEKRHWAKDHLRFDQNLPSYQCLDIRKSHPRKRLKKASVSENPQTQVNTFQSLKTEIFPWNTSRSSSLNGIWFEIWLEIWIRQPINLLIDGGLILVMSDDLEFLLVELQLKVLKISRTERNLNDKLFMPCHAMPCLSDASIIIITKMEESFVEGGRGSEDFVSNFKKKRTLLRNNTCKQIYECLIKCQIFCAKNIYANALNNLFKQVDWRLYRLKDSNVPKRGCKHYVNNRLKGDLRGESKSLETACDRIMEIY
uniref:Uncharacterized protein n=1 Tax=Glossina pallidipes TaxID=7398 RepID=A0A1A9ZAX7_GLOPL